MRRWIAVALGALLAGCMTYQQDLDRARRHYEQTHFDESLALLRILEPDMDSFSTAERAQYAYLRGMTDYRLASIAPAGSSVSDPKKGYRSNARHWLAVASAIDKQTPGGLTDDEKNRLGEAMKDLNQDVFSGDAEAPVADAKPDAGAPAPKHDSELPPP